MSKIVGVKIKLIFLPQSLRRVKDRVSQSFTTGYLLCEKTPFTLWLNYGFLLSINFIRFLLAWFFILF